MLSSTYVEHLADNLRHFLEQAETGEDCHPQWRKVVHGEMGLPTPTLGEMDDDKAFECRCRGSSTLFILEILFQFSNLGINGMLRVGIGIPNTLSGMHLSHNEIKNEKKKIFPWHPL